jgi:hypothetical protein
MSAKHAENHARNNVAENPVLSVNGSQLTVGSPRAAGPLLGVDDNDGTRSELTVAITNAIDRP